MTNFNLSSSSLSFSEGSDLSFDETDFIHFTGRPLQQFIETSPIDDCCTLDIIETVKVDDMENIFPGVKEVDRNDSLDNRVREEESLKDTNTSKEFRVEDVTDFSSDTTGMDKTYCSSYPSETSWPEIDTYAAPWGHYDLENDPWNDDKPVVRFRKYEDIQLNEEEKNGILTERIVASSSSYLDRCPETGKYVLCKCDLKQKGLKDISILTYHHYLQYLNLSGNMITNLECLSQLPFLMYLDVSRNMLSDLLNFKAPFNLTYVNFSYNYVDIIPDLSAFWSIVHLDLSHNQIYSISGLNQLRHLRCLDLSHNKIKHFQNLAHMKLTHLNVSQNQIKSYEEHDGNGLSSLKDLISVDFSDNSLKTLRLFANVVKLQKLIITNNHVACLYEMEYLSMLRYLTEVDFQNNPISSEPRYYEVCLNCIKSITVLDGEYVSAEHKVHVKSKFNPSPFLISAQKHANLLKLEQLTSYDNPDTFLPFTKPTFPIIVLVGPPGSGKVQLVQAIYEKYKKRLYRGVTHTTRPQSDRETEGECYYFISQDKFQEMIRKAEFITVSEILGYSYGVSYSELAKCPDDCALILQTDLISALSLRMRNLRPILILTLYLQNEKYYSELLKKYCYTYWLSRSYKVIRILSEPIQKQSSSESVTICSEIENLLKEIIETLPVRDPREKKSSVKFTDDKPIMLGDVAYSDLDSYYSQECEHHSTDSFEMVSLINNNIKGAANLRSKSISTNNLVRGSMCQSISQVEFDFEPILSVVSEHILFEEDTEDIFVAHPSKTVKPNEKVDSFIHGLLAIRQEYITFNRENPGIFRETIFTEKAKEAMEILETVLKETLENPSRRRESYSFEADPGYEEIVKHRLDNLEAEIFASSTYTYDNYLCNL